LYSLSTCQPTQCIGTVTTYTAKGPVTTSGTEALARQAGTVLFYYSTQTTLLPTFMNRLILFWSDTIPGGKLRLHQGRTSISEGKGREGPSNALTLTLLFAGLNMKCHGMTKLIQS